MFKQRFIDNTSPGGKRHYLETGEAEQSHLCLFVAVSVEIATVSVNALCLAVEEVDTEMRQVIQRVDSDGFLEQEPFLDDEDFQFLTSAVLLAVQNVFEGLSSRMAGDVPRGFGEASPDECKALGTSLLKLYSLSLKHCRNAIEYGFALLKEEGQISKLEGEKPEASEAAVRQGSSADLKDLMGADYSDNFPLRQAILNAMTWFLLEDHVMVWAHMLHTSSTRLRALLTSSIRETRGTILTSGN